MNKISNHPEDTGTSVENMPRLQVIFLMIFGTVFVTTILVIAVFIPTPTDFQYGIFRTILATAAAGVAVFIPGILHLTLSRGKLFALRAGGALAVFAVVYFFDPARWLVTVHAKDQAQVQINREGNNIINNTSPPVIVIPKTEENSK